MNQTDERTDSIEHLDHEPQCGTRFHKGPPRAHFWISKHGCDDRLICKACVKKIHDAYDAASMSTGYCRCDQCGGRFDDFDAAYQVKPL